MTNARSERLRRTAQLPRLGESLVALDSPTEGDLSLPVQPSVGSCFDPDPIRIRADPPVSEQPSVEEENVLEAIEMARHGKSRRGGVQDVPALVVGDDHLVVALHQIDP